MDAVGLVQARIGGHAVEQERHERHLGVPGDGREHVREFAGELHAVVRRQAHARQQNAGARGAQPRDDLVEIGAHRLRALTAQTVVGAKRHDDDLGPRAQHPVDAPPAAGGRVAAHPGVDHAIGVAFAREARLETRRIGLVGGDAEAGGEAIPEGDDDRIGARGRGPRDEPRDQHAERDARDETAHFASVV